MFPHQFIEAEHVKQQLMCWRCETVAQLHEHYVLTGTELKIGDVAGGILMQVRCALPTHSPFRFEVK